MADKYHNFDELSGNEQSGVDFGIRVRRARTAFAVVAPHGGGIEAGTSELADGVARTDLSFYAFDGLKRTGNADLHITSTRFDEPMCLVVLAHSAVVVTMHGEESTSDGEGVFVGGLDEALGAEIGAALTAQGFDVRRHGNPRLQGREPTNLCNRGTTGAGVQLELSRAVRRTLFESLTAEGRTHPTPRFDRFVTAVRTVIERHL